MICDECETVAHCMKNGCVPKTTKKDEAMKLALEALENAVNDSADFERINFDECEKAITALREALTSVPDWASEAIEQPSGVATIAPVQQEPVAWALYQRNLLLSFWMDKGDAYDFEFTSEHRWEPLYTSPQAQRKPLPKDEWPKHPSPYWNDEYLGFSKSDLTDYAMQVLAAHGIKEKNCD